MPGRARSAAAAPAGHTARPRNTGRIAEPLALRNAGNLRSFLQAVVPEHLERGHVAVGGEIVPDHRALGEHEGAHAFLLNALDADHLAIRKVQRHIRRAQNVAGHVAQRAATEVVEPAPVERLVEESAVAIGFGLAARRERPLVGRAEPQIPIQRGRNRILFRNLREALRPHRPVAPRVHFSHVADVAVPDDFRRLPRAFVGITLVAHLRGHLVFRGRLAQLTRFPDRPHQRLLHVNMLAAFHTPHGRRGMHVIRYGDDHRIDVLAFLIQHLPEVFVLRRLVKAREHGGCAAVVHIAERHDIFRGRRGRNIRCRLTAGANRREVQFLVGGFVSRAFQ